MTIKSAPFPFYVVNDDQQVINLEHVLPRRPEGNWPQFTPEEAEGFFRRLGNMALMIAKDNSDLKSLPFAEKKKVYAESPYELTNQMGALADWTKDDIVARQRTMAEYAAKTWPLAVT